MFASLTISLIRFVDADLKLNWSALEYSLSVYLSQPAFHAAPFSLNDVLHYEAPAAEATPHPDISTHHRSAYDGPVPSGDNVSTDLDSSSTYLESINSIPEFAVLGPLYKYVFWSIIDLFHQFSLSNI